TPTPTNAYGAALQYPGAKSTQSKSAFNGLNQGLAEGSTPLGPAGVGHQAVTIPRNRLVHAVASLQVGVKSKDLSAKTNEASQIVGSFGGYAQSVRYQATHQGDGESILDLRVPVQNAQKAIAKVGGLGMHLSAAVSTQAVP